MTLKKITGSFTCKPKMRFQWVVAWLHLSTECSLVASHHNNLHYMHGYYRSKCIDKKERNIILFYIISFDVILLLSYTSMI